jgi:branched-chain amino acid aminotransferase
VHPFVFHNDRLLRIEAVRLSPGQVGLLNGWGVFTTLRVVEGIAFAFERHWNRLARDAERIQIPLPTRIVVRDAVRQLISANAVQSGCIRIYGILNKGDLWQSGEPLPTVDLIAYSTDLPIREGAARLGVMPHGRHAANPLTGTKVTAWLNNAWHVEQAHRQGYNDAILLNERSEVAECTAANVFCVRRGELFTPPTSSGCLRGVTREILLEIAPKAEIPIAEQVLTMQDLYSADEVFISSTTRSVQPVQQIADRTIAREPGPVTLRLAEFFSKYVRDYLERSLLA